MCDPSWCVVPLASSSILRGSGSRSQCPRRSRRVLCAATVENPLEYIGNLLREAPEPEEAMMPRAAQTRLRPAALAVPGGGAGDGDGSSDVSPRADLPPPLSPGRSPGSIATPLSKTKMESLSLQSPSPRPLDMTRSTSYDTISVR